MKFEYLINEIRADSMSMFHDLKEEGENGWELVAVRDLGSGFVQLVYKRELKTSSAAIPPPPASAFGQSRL